MGKGQVDIEDDNNQNAIDDEKEQIKVKKSKAFKSEFEEAEDKFRDTKFDQKVKEMIGQGAKKHKFKPDTMKSFEKLYDQSMSTRTIITPQMSKGQKRRTIKREKLNKKKVSGQIGLLLLILAL